MACTPSLFVRSMFVALPLPYVVEYPILARNRLTKLFAYRSLSGIAMECSYWGFHSP